MLCHFKNLLQHKFSLRQMSRAAFHLTSNQFTKSEQYEQYTKLFECDGVREITLREPKTRNPLSLRMMEEIMQHLCAEWHNKNLRCIIISSTGPVWSAGHDLKEISPECGVEQQTLVFEKLAKIVENIRRAPVPVIAKVNGIVAAGGVQLVASCDMVVCTEKSHFMTPSANIGVFASTPAVIMSRLMPHNKCLDMLLTGHPITAQDALKYGITQNNYIIYSLQGLVSRVVSEADLDKEMEKIIISIKSKSRAVLALGKEFFYKQLELPLEQAYQQAIKKMIENLNLTDSHEGIRSFMEKRKPNWSHITIKILKAFLPKYYASCLIHTTGGPTLQKFVEVVERNGVREITLNDPKTRNSLSMAMMDDILEALCLDWSNKELRCIILKAHGNVWSAGHNLRELGPCKPSKKQTEIFEKLTKIILSIYKAPVPVIAEVNGLAAAAGCQLAASCDFVIATDKSTFMTPGANFGIFCSTPGIAVSRVMSRSNAAYMLMTGLPINAQQAYQAGLVARVVSEDNLEKEMCEITSAIKAKSHAVIALGKKFYYEQLQLPLEEAYRLGAEKMTENLALPDTQEGITAFKEKRKPMRRYVRVQQSDGVRELIINDPTSNNSLTTIMMDTLSEEIRSDWSDEDLRCIVLRTVIVNGLVAAAGCQLVASCDFVVAIDKNAFITIADIGLFCSIPGIAKSRVMSRSKPACLVTRLVNERDLYTKMLSYGY
uniref:Enoyl-CoA hydratase domain-containing protein 3, mitochondrial n=1 Tax=Glossina austeni TaxID=7395 RepID=A0A1A9UGZ4_GLOAU